MNSFDIVATEFTSTGITIHATGTYNLPDQYKNKYLKIINAHGNTTLQELGELNVWTAIVFANAINQFILDNKLNKEKIIAIASHGQTIWHSPNSTPPFTLQLGDPSVIAEKTGITTIADFRSADIAAGGQGAPLAPAFHKAVFASTNEPRCVINIGGYSNISILENGKHLGFDTGPGNCLLDHWTTEHFNKPCDVDGMIAKTGKVIPQLLEVLLNDQYFKKSPPKSTGREYFNAAWLQDNLNKFQADNFPAQDVLVTLVHLTAQTITDAIKTYANANTKVYICGGGAHNPELLKVLSTLLEQQIQTTFVLGIDPDWVEATLFAWLAKQRITEQKIDLTEITGSTHPVILGALYKPK
jgi:anhydro-N-acetylmuramic acid kinase